MNMSVKNKLADSEAVTVDTSLRIVFLPQATVPQVDMHAPCYYH